MRKRRLCSAAFLFVLAWVLAVSPAFAQGKSTAALRGTVKDSSGGVVAGAKVTLKGEGTGLTQTTTTNDAGLYSFVELPVGSYSVEVEFTGFKSAIAKNIVLNVADTRAVDVQLATGGVSEQVTVEVPAVAVQTVGADVSGLVTGEQVRELPLNGRNFMQLTLLMPGVTATETMNSRDKGLSGGSDVSVSGGTTTSNLWTVDGASNNDVGSNRTILVYPSIDAIEEFKIQRNNYGAEFGQAGGAQVNLVTRGGTNDFHGSGYYYARRDSWLSKDFFLKQANQENAPLKWDDFGGTIGGPIMKDKLHFFFSEEVNKDKKSAVRTAFVPTDLERLGNFTGPRVSGCTLPAPIDPLTGQPFPGNVIPANRINPAGTALLALYSKANVTPTSGCNNWLQAVATPVDWRQENARLDWTLNNRTRLMVRYTQDSWKADTNNWGDDPFPLVGSIWNQPGKSLVSQLNQNIGSHMVNSLTFSYSANKIEVARGGTNPELVDALTAVLPTAFPASIKISGGASQPWFQGAGGYGSLWNQAPWVNNQDLFVLKDDYSAVFGKHLIKAGLLGSYNKKNEQPNNASQESVVFGGASGFVGPGGYTAGLTTGNALADLLLRGMAFDTNEVQTNASVLVRWKDFEGYLADSFKATSHITVDVGLRLSHLTMPYMADDRYGSFNPGSVNRAAGNSPCNGVLYAPGKNPCPALGLAGGSDGPNRSLQPMKALLLAPRLGFAWDVSGDGKSALRGGVGRFYSRERVSPALGMGGSPPFSGVANITRTLDAAASVRGGSAALAFGSPGAGWDQVAANPYSWQWNLTYERELVRNTTVDVSYVGNKGIDLTGSTNVNQIRPGDNNGNGLADRLEYARTADGSLRPLNGIAGIGNGNVGLWQHNRHSIYHGLQAQLLSRFGHGSQAQVSYTFSRAIADTGIDSADGGNGISQVLTFTDTSNPGLDRGRAGIDRTHVLNASLVLALPTFDGKSSFVKNVFGDWEVTSIVSKSSGYPITIYVGGVPNLPGGPAGTGQGDNQRPNVVEGQACHVSGGSSKTQWLNPAAWTLNGYIIGTNGNSGRGVCEGPGFFQTDMALYKNIKVGQRVKLQLRAEVFNLFNTVNFIGTTVNNNYNATTATFDTGSGSTATRIVSATPSGNFGQLTQARDPRQMQLGLRLSF